MPSASSKPDQLLLDRALQLADYFKAVASLSPEEMNEKTFQELSGLVRHCAQNSNWWLSRLGDLPSQAGDAARLLEAFHLIPVLLRDDLEASQKWMKIWLRKSNSQDYFRRAMAGASGNSIEFLFYRPEFVASQVAIQILQASWQKRSPNSKTLYLLDSHSLASEVLSLEALAVQSPKREVTVVDCTSLSDAQIIETLKASGADDVVLGSSLAKRIAREKTLAASSKFYIDHFYCLGELLNEKTKQVLSDHFGAKVYQSFFLEEFGAVAISCADNSHLHALQFANHLEVLEANGEPCPINQTGRLIVTSLLNRAMPLIRSDSEVLGSWMVGNCPKSTAPMIRIEIEA